MTDSEDMQEMLDSLMEAHEQVATGKVSQFILLGMGPGEEEPLFHLAGNWNERDTLATIGLMGLAQRRLYDLLQAIDAEMIDREVEMEMVGEDETAH